MRWEKESHLQCGTFLCHVKVRGKEAQNRVNWPTPHCVDGKTEVLRGQEFLPAHMASIKNKLPNPCNGCSSVPVLIREAGLDSGPATPWLGTTEQYPTYKTIRRGPSRGPAHLIPDHPLDEASVIGFVHSPRQVRHLAFCGTEAMLNPG